MEKEVKFFNIRLPKALHDEFKEEFAKRDIPMSVVLRELMKAELKRVKREDPI